MSYELNGTAQADLRDVNEALSLAAPTGLAKWIAARNRVLSNLNASPQRAKLLVLTNSYGVGGASGGFTTNRFWNKMAAVMNAAGIGTNLAAMGMGNQTAANLILDDTRYQSITGMASQRPQNLPRNLLGGSAAGQTFVFKPGKAFDTIEVVHNGFNNSGLAGAYQLSVDGVNVGSVVQTQNAGGEILVKTTFSGLTGTSTSQYTITTVTGSGGGNLTMFASHVSYMSTASEVDIFCSYQAGLSLSDHLGTVAPYQNGTQASLLYPALAFYQFDLVVSLFSINEASGLAGSTTTPTIITGCLNSLAVRQATYGSTLFVRPPRTQITSIAQTYQDQEISLLRANAQENGNMVMDYSKRYGTYEAAVAAFGSTIYSDDRHLTNYGQADLGAQIGRLLAA